MSVVRKIVPGDQVFVNKRGKFGVVVGHGLLPGTFIVVIGHTAYRISRSELTLVESTVKKKCNTLK